MRLSMLQRHKLLQLPPPPKQLLLLLPQKLQQ